MKFELNKAIREYCEENHCWKARNTAKEWNECLGTNYAAATFTAAVKCGWLCREKWDKSYVYYLPLTDEMIKAEAAAKRERDIKYAKYVIEQYEENIAATKARYEKRIKHAQEDLERDLAWEEERLAEAKNLLSSMGE